MQVKPIIFSAPMIRALLAGRKSQTRRILKPQPGDMDQPFQMEHDGSWHVTDSQGSNMSPLKVPYVAGDLLWVRETWADVNTECGPAWAYRANGSVIQPDFDGVDFGAGPSFNYDKYPGDYTMWVTDLFDGAPDHRWRPSIHMPRWASRLTLEVTEVRVQRLQEMEGQHPSESDAIAEGVNEIHHGDGAYYYSAFRDEPHPKNWCDPTDAFRELWNSLHGPKAWDANPWVAAIIFTTHHKNVDQLLTEREAA